jgi:DNA-binding GntR family transcriptional regulator
MRVRRVILFLLMRLLLGLPIARPAFVVSLARRFSCRLAANCDHSLGWRMRGALSSPNLATAASAAEGGERVTLGHRAFGAMREMLISGRLSPGDKVSLRSMAESLGVSMQPVREAVARLVADEALEVLPNRAVRVPVMTLARFRELTRIRLAIEGFAAASAAEARGPGDIAAIRRHDAAFRRQCRAQTPDSGAAVASNQALHFAVYRAARLPTLVPIIEGLWLRIGPVLNLDMRASPERLKLGTSESCHRLLVRAIEARDGAGARRALESDIRGTARFIESRGVLPE